jgi:hypothetical protein
MLILRKSSPKKYHFLAEGRNFQKNIGPTKDSMAYRQVLPRMPQRNFCDNRDKSPRKKCHANSNGLALVTEIT